MIDGNAVPSPANCRKLFDTQWAFLTFRFAPWKDDTDEEIYGG
jgi:hypothetical protein